MANEKRLIDANALMERLKFKRKISEFGLYRGLESAMAQCKKAPTVDAVEVVHAEWIRNAWNDYSCSACNCQLIGHGASGWNYCPNCGAKMDGERREGE